jgi:hypothetical protein
VIGVNNTKFLLEFNVVSQIILRKISFIGDFVEINGVHFGMKTTKPVLDMKLIPTATELFNPSS